MGVERHFAVQTRLALLSLVWVVGAAAAVVQEVLGSLLLPQQDFLHSPQGFAVGVEVEAVGNDVEDADDDAVTLPHLHSQTLTVTSEGSWTSANKTHVIKQGTCVHI